MVQLCHLHDLEMAELFDRRPLTDSHCGQVSDSHPTLHQKKPCKVHTLTRMLGCPAP